MKNERGKELNMLAKFFLVAGTVLISTSLYAQSTSEQQTALYFDSIKNQPKALTQFLFDMPKGGDLHTHHSGATLAENMLTYAKGAGLCIDKNTWTVTVNPACPKDQLLDTVTQDNTAYNAIIDAWSMRHFTPGRETGHDHFFATFGKYSPIPKMFGPGITSEILERAGLQNEIYVELMVTPDNNAAALLGKEAGWDKNLSALREKLFGMGLKNILRDITSKLDDEEAKINTRLRCGTQDPMQGCKVTLRYHYQVKREQPPEQVFAQLLMGFEAASADKRIVGINLVQPEDGTISMRDYDLQMQMIGFLHNLYPHVNISLHAGELAPGLVPYQDLGKHIGKAVRIAQANRIGHGVDVSYENQPNQLLDEMAKKNILVEINLSSNETILGVAGKNHPLPLYMQHHVPVALSTDDEGVLRSDLTEQYVKAVRSYHFSYPIIKTLVRNSIAYSFLPGPSLWNDKAYSEVNVACVNNQIGGDSPSASCQAFLKQSEKAQLQWKLEKQFLEFEQANAQPLSLVPARSASDVRHSVSN